MRTQADAGVLDTTITPLGKKLFHTWLLRPLINRERINARLDAVQVLSSGDNVAARKLVRKELSGFRNMLTIINRIKKSQGTWRDWQALVVVRYFTRCPVSLITDCDLGHRHQGVSDQHDVTHTIGDRY